MQKYKPSPIAYNPEVKVKAKMIPFSKGERVNFLCDAEYLGKVKPGAGKYQPSFKLVKCRSTEFKYYNSKVDRTKWKSEKSALPDSAYNKTDSADKIVYKTSQRFAAVKANPVSFSQYHATLVKVVPGAGHYILKAPTKSFISQ